MNEIICTFCGKPISPEIIKRRHLTQEELRRRRSFCTPEHSVAWNEANGFYEEIGARGNEVQTRQKNETGQIPKYEKRRDAVAASNHDNPRRRPKKEHHIASENHIVGDQEGPNEMPKS